MIVGDWLAARTRTLLAAGAGAAALLLVWGALGSAPLALAGWLVGLLFWLGVALGAMVLLAIHALTGGAWIRAAMPILAPAAATLVVFSLLAVPLLLAAGLVWPWVRNSAMAADPAVAAWYLNANAFALRSAVALLGWALLGLWLARGGAWHAAAGASALVFHALAFTWFSQDWVLSFDPHYRSTAFPAAFGVTQLATGLAWCALLRPPPSDGRGRADDLMRVLFAAALGATYLGYARYVVAWYGNLPDKAAWFLQRQAMPWVVLEGISLLTSFLLPLAALLPPVTRHWPRAFAWIGALVLLGVLLHLVWLVGPAIGREQPALAILAALVGTAAVGGLWVGLAVGPFAARFPCSPPAAAHGA